jgi:cytoskeletal protein RodZ
LTVSSLSAVIVLAVILGIWVWAAVTVRRRRSTEFLDRVEAVAHVVVWAT